MYDVVITDLYNAYIIVGVVVEIKPQRPARVFNSDFKPSWLVLKCIIYVFPFIPVTVVPGVFINVYHRNVPEQNMT